MDRLGNLKLIHTNNVAWAFINEIINIEIRLKMQLYLSRTP
jgi:hypothetical protein